MEGIFTNAVSNGTIPNPLRPRLPQDWGFATPSKTPIAIISGTGKATDLKFGRYIHTVHPNKSPLRILEKREHGHIQGRPIFKEPLIIPGTGSKVTNFKFCTHIHRIDRNESPLKISGKVALGVVRDSLKFSCYPYIIQGASRGHQCGSSAFLSIILRPAKLNTMRERRWTTMTFISDKVVRQCGLYENRFGFPN